MFAETVHRLHVIAFLEGGIARLQHAPNGAADHRFVERRRTGQPRPHGRIDRHVDVFDQHLPLFRVRDLGFDDPKLLEGRQPLRTFDQMDFSATHFFSFRRRQLVS